MIIVSQTKRTITNFDNINTICVTKTGKIISFDNSYRASDGYSDIIGIYKTEERAKEVLQEIIEKYKEIKTDFNINMTDCKNIYNASKVYEMPKE